MRWIDAPVEDVENSHPKKVSNNQGIKKRKHSGGQKAIDSDAVLLKMLIRLRNGPLLKLRPDGNPTYAMRRNIVEAYRTVLEEMDATHFLTFMPGYFVSPETIAANIIKFSCRLDRKALGKNGSKTMTIVFV